MPGLKYYSILLLPLFVLLAFPNDIGAQDKMKITYFHDYKPMSWKDRNGLMQGIFIDVLNESLNKRMGVSVSHSGYPWARAQYFVKTGDADAFVTVPTPERKTYTLISAEPIISGNATIFTYTNNPKIELLTRVKTFSDLKGFSQIQYIGNGWAKQHFNGADVSWVPTLSDALKILSYGDYDFFSDTSQIIKYNIREMGYQNKIVEVPGVVLPSEPFHLCINKKSSYVDLLPTFDKTIQAMRKDGTMDAIFEKYQ